MKKYKLLFVLISTFLLISQYSFADEPTEAVEEKPADKQEEPSFKRLEFSYESQWLNGHFWEGQYQPAGGAHSSFNWNLKTRLDVYKLAFYVTPKTYIEGSFGTGHIRKDQSGWIDDFGLGIIRLHVTGNRIALWSADVCQNIFSHRKTNIALDGFVGFVNYEERVRLTDYATDPLFGWNRRYNGPRFGVRLKVPFNLPKVKKVSFALNANVSYAPHLDMKSEGFDAAWPDRNLNNSGRGNAFETQVGLSCQLTPNISVYAMYNYLRFRQERSDYYAGQIPGLVLHKSKTVFDGPSVGVTLRY